jgi:hypothetical protein
MAQGGTSLGMYPGLTGQGMQGGFGNNMSPYGAFGMSNNGAMDMAATQRAMLEAAQNGQMQQSMQNQNGNQFNQGGTGVYQGGMSSGNVPGSSGNDWMNQHQSSRPVSEKTEEEDQQQQQQQNQQQQQQQQQNQQHQQQQQNPQQQQQQNQQQQQYR